jgi:hypothetical protein
LGHLGRAGVIGDLFEHSANNFTPFLFRVTRFRRDAGSKTADAIDQTLGYSARSKTGASCAFCQPTTGIVSAAKPGSKR